MAAAHQCGYDEVGLPVQKASQCAHDQRGGRRRRQEEEQRHVCLSGDVEAGGIEEGKLCVLLCPLEGRVEQALLPLFLYLLFFYPHSPPLI